MYIVTLRPHRCNGELSYIGGAWQRDVAFAGNDVPLQGDFSAREMIFNASNVHEERRDELIDLLDINLDWRMHQVGFGLGAFQLAGVYRFRQLSASMR